MSADRTAWTCERQDDDHGDIYWAIHDARTYAFIANVYSIEKHANMIAAAPATSRAAREMLAALEDIAYGRVPRPSNSGMHTVTAADRAREAIAAARAAGIKL